MIGYYAGQAHENGDCNPYTCGICAFLDEQEADESEAQA